MGNPGCDLLKVLTNTIKWLLIPVFVRILMGFDSKLSSHSLAEYNTAEEIVFAMGITLGKLRFLITSRHTSPITHHLRFKISKKTGGERIISAQKPNIKAAQSFSCARFELG